MNFPRRTFLRQIGLGIGTLGFVSSWPSSLGAELATGRKFLRGNPESQGVRSEGILDFLRALSQTKHEFHSFVLARHGQVIAEAWWSPYRPDLNHMLYSLSKSFTSTAIGLARSEGKLSIDQPVISFFADETPAEISENLRNLKIKHLLSMSVGHAQDSTPLITKEDNWVKTFLALPIPNEPGTQFLYNSGATYMLSAIVQKVSGQRVIDYLKPRLFERLGIKGMTWETCPHGINTGGWGLSVQTEALAKFGRLYLDHGAWNGNQLLAADWVAEATSFKIQQPGKDLEKLKRESDWHQGYCYQFWRCRHNGFRGDGAFGQFTLVLPEQDAVIAITSESQDMQGELNLVWDHLLPAMQSEALPANKAAAEELHRTIGNLALLPPKGQPTCPTADSLSGKNFAVANNDAGVQSVAFRFNRHGCLFTLTDREGSYPIRCGLEKWALGETTMPGTPPRLTRKPIPGKFKIAASGTWKDAQTFEMTWRFIETPHHDTVSCRFEGNEVKVGFLHSLKALSPERPSLTGKLAA